MTVSLPPEMMREIEKMSRLERKSRRQLVRDAIALYEETQTERRWQTVRKAGRRTAKPLGITTDEELDRIIHEDRGV